jgi:hypothetical protein
MWRSAIPRMLPRSLYLDEEVFERVSYAKRQDKWRMTR